MKGKRENAYEGRSRELVCTSITLFYFFIRVPSVNVWFRRYFLKRTSNKNDYSTSYRPHLSDVRVFRNVRGQIRSEYPAFEIRPKHVVYTWLLSDQPSYTVIFVIGKVSDQYPTVVPESNVLVRDCSNVNSDFNRKIYRRQTYGDRSPTYMVCFSRPTKR